MNDLLIFMDWHLIKIPKIKLFSLKNFLNFKPTLPRPVEFFVLDTDMILVSPNWHICIAYRPKRSFRLKHFFYMVKFLLFPWNSFNFKQVKSNKRRPLSFLSKPSRIWVLRSLTSTKSKMTIIERGTFLKRIEIYIFKWLYFFEDI